MKTNAPTINWLLFRPWLLTQPPNKAFEFTNTNSCIIATFLHEKCKIKARVAIHEFWDTKTEAIYEIPRPIAKAVLDSMIVGINTPKDVLAKLDF